MKRMSIWLNEVFCLLEVWVLPTLTSFTSSDSFQPYLVPDPELHLCKYTNAPKDTKSYFASLSVANNQIRFCSFILTAWWQRGVVDDYYWLLLIIIDYHYYYYHYHCSYYYYNSPFIHGWNHMIFAQVKNVRFFGSKGFNLRNFTPGEHLYTLTKTS